MRKMIAILTTSLLASSLFAAQAEARARGFGGGHAIGMGHLAADRIGGGDHRYINRPLQHVESYPRYLPNGSCIDLWYTIPGYQGPEDCP
jgi:hypothetical protein